MALPDKLLLSPIQIPGSPTSHDPHGWEIRKLGCSLSQTAWLWDWTEQRKNKDVRRRWLFVPEVPGLLCSDFVFHFLEGRALLEAR